VQVVRVDLIRGEIGERWALPDSTFTDLVWVHSRSDEGLDHLTVRTSPDHIDVVLFLCLPKRDFAEETARLILARVVELAPTLRGWILGFWS
jgi:hypothetical protein